MKHKFFTVQLASADSEKEQKKNEAKIEQFEKKLNDFRALNPEYVQSDWKHSSAASPYYAFTVIAVELKTI